MLREMLYEKGLAPPVRVAEIGARPIEASPEPFYPLVKNLPGSEIIAFEPDPQECDQLNRQSPGFVTFYPYAIARAEEERTFYMTRDPMCSSLYPPNEKYISLFQNLEVALLKETTTLDTVSLDYFRSENSIGPVDLIKADIQGAELEAFEGGAKTLEDVLVIVSEVEFVEVYQGQPLFGDVCSFLARCGFTFHKFLGYGGRAMKPVVVNNNINQPVQVLWSDAVFIKDPLAFENLSSEKMLKFAMLSEVYGSPDLAYFALREHDRKNGTSFENDYAVRLGIR